MVYNLRKKFKDVLKIISLGIMASINGASGDVFAMDEKYQGCRQFHPHGAQQIQGKMTDDVALKRAFPDKI